MAPAYRSTAVELIEFEELFATLCLSAFFAKSRLLCLRATRTPTEPWPSSRYLPTPSSTVTHFRPQLPRHAVQGAKPPRATGMPNALSPSRPTTVYGVRSLAVSQCEGVTLMNDLPLFVAFQFGELDVISPADVLRRHLDVFTRPAPLYLSHAEPSRNP